MTDASQPRPAPPTGPDAGDCCGICFYSRTRTIEGTDYLCCCCVAPATVSSDVPATTKAQWPIVDEAEWCGDGMDMTGRKFGVF